VNQQAKDFHGDALDCAWLSRRTYAMKYGISLRTIAKWVAANLLETYRCARVIRIRDAPPDQHRRTGEG
jgi:hypothetical protein